MDTSRLAMLWRHGAFPGLLLGALVWAGCASDDDDNDGDVESCKPGKVHECTCRDDTPGAHVCLDDGTWDECICSAYTCGGQICDAPPDIDTSDIQLSGAVGEMIGQISVDTLEAVGIARRPDGCCTADGECGVIHPQLSSDGVCRAVGQEGKLSDECPTEELQFSVPLVPGSGPDGQWSLPFEGCCREDGFCGLELNAIRVGCEKRTSFITHDFGEMTCTY
jgi:hypothetical protein